MEEILIAEVSLQEGKRADDSTWSRWRIKDGNGRTFSTFDEQFAAQLKQGSKARIEFEEKDLGGGRKVKNITAVEASNGSVPETYSHKTPDGEPDWDKVALGKTRCALWASFFESQLAASLYLAATKLEGRDPVEFVLIHGTRLIVHAERDVFERPAGDNGVPFSGDNGDVPI